MGGERFTPPSSNLVIYLLTEIETIGFQQRPQGGFLLFVDLSLMGNEPCRMLSPALPPLIDMQTPREALKHPNTSFDSHTHLYLET